MDILRERGDTLTGEPIGLGVCPRGVWCDRGVTTISEPDPGLKLGLDLGLEPGPDLGLE